MEEIKFRCFSSSLTAILDYQKYLELICFNADQITLYLIMYLWYFPLCQPLLDLIKLPSYQWNLSIIKNYYI